MICSHRNPVLPFNLLETPAVLIFAIHPGLQP